jgi:hypothetical protein
MQSDIAWLDECILGIAPCAGDIMGALSAA